MSAAKTLGRFAEITSMHGVPWIIQARSTLRRVLWSVVCVFAAIMLCVQISLLLKRYFSYPKKVLIGVDRSPITFPSITLCNKRALDPYILNQIHRLYSESRNGRDVINKTDNMYLYNYFVLMAINFEMYAAFSDDYAEAFDKLFTKNALADSLPPWVILDATVPVDQFVVNCDLAMHHGCNRSTDFTRIFDANYFSCFTHSITDSKHMIIVEGEENGWGVTLFTGSGLLDSSVDYIPSMEGAFRVLPNSEGVRVIIHPQGTKPFPLTEGFDVPPAMAASFGIQSHRVRRLGLPHGNCTDRNPFGGEEKTYRMISCQRMCVQQHVMEQCGCKDSSLPDVPGRDIRGCLDITAIPHSCMHTVSKECERALSEFNERIKCLTKHREVILIDPGVLEECRCHPPCDEEIYDISYSLAKWPGSGYEGTNVMHRIVGEENFLQRFDNTQNEDKIAECFSHENYTRALNDFLRVNVYLSDSNVLVTEEEADYSSTQLLSDIGGQLGLWVGISVITATEVLALIVDLLRLVPCNKCGKTRHNQVPTG